MHCTNSAEYAWRWVYQDPRHPLCRSICLFVRGLHSQGSTARSRVFYLFHRFIKDTRNDIPVDLIVSLLDGFRDILTVQVEIPETEETDQQILLAEAVSNPGLFDAQLYLFETAGTLISVLHKSIDQRQQASILLSVVKPLLDALSASLHSATKDSREIMPILEIHHIIIALGNIAKGFPEFPSPTTEGYVLPPLETFRQIAQAILVCLEAMNIFKIVRDAVSNFAPEIDLDTDDITDEVCVCSNHCNNWTECHSLHTASDGQSPCTL